MKIKSSSCSLLAVFVTSVLFLSCSSTSSKKVFPAPGGNLRVFAESSSKFKAQEEALDVADQHCRKDGKQIKIIRETVNSDYAHKEKVRKDADRGSTIYGVMGGDTEEAKRVKEVSEALPSSSNYRAEVIFECQ
jgi:hypothetical protein